MKKLLALITVCLLILTACSSQQQVVPIDTSIDATTSISDDSDSVFIFSRESTLAESDAVLEDNTGYGFAYDASNVLDQDFSTAWCRSAVNPDDGPFAGGLTLTFSESPAGKTLGIVPGFARDDSIYFQNNRVKTLVLVDSASPLMEDNYVYELEDTYGMQFITLPDDLGDHFMLSVADVYPGSKYDDTCIAEVDLWSDYVENEDADAAYDYYVQNKKDAALRPVGVEDDGVEFLFANDYENVKPGDLISSCGARSSSVEKKYWSMGFAIWKGDNIVSGYGEELGWYGEAGEQAVLSAKMNQWAEEGDEIMVKWWNDNSYYRPETLDLKLLQVSSVEVKACDNGALYISDVFSKDAASIGVFVVEMYYQNKLVGKDEFTLMQ